MENISELPFSTEGWPSPLAETAPHLWLAGSIIALLAVSYLAGFASKKLIRFIGRKYYETDDEFLGSSWDLAAPVIQLLLFLLVFTGGAELLGFQFGQQLIGFWPKVLAGLAIISGAVMLATWINRSLRSYGQRAHMRNKVDDTLIGFSASIIRYTILGVAILMAMTQFGFAPGSLIAIVGAIGLAIALALQDTLKAVAAGFMIAAFRPFRIGDWVQIGDHEGAVINITPFTTTISQIDNKHVLLTNDKVWGDAILNHTKAGSRRLNLFFDVHYDTDLDKALEVLKSIANDHTNVRQKDDTWVGVHNLGNWSISLRLRAWVLAQDFVQVKADITKSVKQEFDREGIEIPYPHQVELVREGIDLKLNAAVEHDKTPDE